MRILRPGVSVIANASSVVPPNVAPRAFVRGVGRLRPRRAVFYARRAPGNVERPPEYATRNEEPPARRGIGIPRRSAHANGNATSSRPPSAMQKACVPSAGRKNSRPVAGCAIPAVRRGARPSEPATRRAKPPVNFTGARIQIYAAGLRGRKARSASIHAAIPGFARVAATGPSSRAARPASLAAMSAARLTTSNMTSGGPKASAADAVDQPMTAARAVAHARCSRPDAMNRKMQPAASAMPGGAQNGFVPIAPSPRREPRDVRLVLAVLICARVNIAACRFFRRATPSSKSRRAKITAHTKVGPM